MEIKKTQFEIWRELLYSSDNKVIEETLEALRKDGNVNILPDIFNIYIGFKDTDFGVTIFNFLTDLKNVDAIEIIMNFIFDIKYVSIRKELVSLCWQTSLDFSNYFDKFIYIFITYDLPIAFEAFTVIEYFENNIKIEKLEKGIFDLQQSISTISSDKKELLVDLVNILRNRLDF